MPLRRKQTRLAAAPVRVVMLLASMVPEVLPLRVLRVETSRVVSESDVLVAQGLRWSHAVVGGVGGIEISGSTGESDDVAGIDGA